MTLHCNRPLRPTPASAHRTPERRFSARRHATGLAVLCASLLFASSVRPVSADPARIFQYDANGALVEVTQTYSYQEHHVYDPLGNLVGTVDDNGTTYDLSGQQTGCVVLIYINDASGTPVEATASYSYQEHHVYDPLGNLVGTVGSTGSITNASGQSIGHITHVGTIPSIPDDIAPVPSGG